MVFNLWSILLIASASQCVFLIVFFANRPSRNKLASRLLILMLSVLLFMTVSNLWYASRIYLDVPWLAGVGRGSTLLLGPAFFLYTLAVVKPDFKLKTKHLLHLLGYVLNWGVLIMQPRPAGLSSEMAAVEAFLMDGLPASPVVLGRFAFYSLHFITYLYLSHQAVKQLKQSNDAYTIAMETRGRWITRLNLILVVLAVAICTGFIYSSVTQYYSFQTNFLLTLIYSFFIYVIAYQALSDDKQVHPEFKLKYQGSLGDEKEKEKTIVQLKKVLEEEKLFLRSDLKQADVASKLNLPAHQLTKLLNSALNQSFFDLINEYRVKHFISLAQDENNKHLSIFGLAQESGFKSKSSFNTAFKKVEGQTPSAFLKNSEVN